MTSSSRLGRIDRHHRLLRYPSHSDGRSGCSRRSRPLPRLLPISDVNVGHHRWTQCSVLDVCGLACRVNILDNRHGARKRLEPPGIPDGAVPENVKRGLQEEVWDDSVFYVAGEHHWHVSTEREAEPRGLTFWQTISGSLYTGTVCHPRLQG